MTLVRMSGKLAESLCPEAFKTAHLSPSRWHVHHSGELPKALHYLHVLAEHSVTCTESFLNKPLSCLLAIQTHFLDSARYRSGGQMVLSF